MAGKKNKRVKVKSFLAHKFWLRSNHIQVKRLRDNPTYMLPPFIGLNLCLSSFLVLTLQM